MFHMHLLSSLNDKIQGQKPCLYYMGIRTRKQDKRESGELWRTLLALQFSAPVMFVINKV